MRGGAVSKARKGAKYGREEGAITVQARGGVSGGP